MINVIEIERTGINPRIETRLTLGIGLVSIHGSCWPVGCEKRTDVDFMSLKEILGDVVLPLAARNAGTYASGPIANPGFTSNVVVLAHATAVNGASPTLDVVLQTSNDGSSWSSVASSATTQLTAAGNAVSNALVDDDYIQVLATAGGAGTPAVTFRVAVLVSPS